MLPESRKLPTSLYRQETEHFLRLLLGRQSDNYPTFDDKKVGKVPGKNCPWNLFRDF